MKKPVVKIAESIEIELHDNGYVVKYSGYNKDEEWIHHRMVCTSQKEMFNMLESLLTMERTN